MHRNAEGTFVRPDAPPTGLLFDIDCYQTRAKAYLASCQMLATAATKHRVATYSRSRHLNLNVARTLIGHSHIKNINGKTIRRIKFIEYLVTHPNVAQKFELVLHYSFIEVKILPVEQFRDNQLRITFSL